MINRMFVMTLAIALASAAPLAAQQPHQLPLKHAPRPTAAAITAADLMTRLYIFADDSMQGRETGTVGHVRSTEYLVRELTRLGLEPAGDDGFIQHVPMIRRAFDVASTIAAGGTTLRGGTDFVAASRGATRPIGEVEVIYGGTVGDTAAPLTADQVRGKLVLLKPAAGRGGGAFGGRGGGRGGRGAAAALAAAAAVATVSDLEPNLVRSLTDPREGDVFMKPGPDAQPAAPTLVVSPGAAAVLLGMSVDSARKGHAGKMARVDVRFRDEPGPALNVVAIARGTDPALRNQYVVIGAHPDHVGFSPARPVDHDSLHLFREASFGIVGMVPRGEQPTADQLAKVAAIRVNLDSVRAVRPPRLDSIRNGADDDGSGSVTLLELAEAFALGQVKPRRSIVFIWQTGEEKGLLGSRWFVEHPTVPRDSIVAQLNMDMIGRGAAIDLPVGGPDFLMLVGSRRLSTELGDIVEQVNQSQPAPLRFDYQYDADGHPENIYCRSDHYNYARWGIPVVFFTTGLHGDYHQVTDEPQYIDYPHMERVARLVFDVAVKVANLDHRVVVDKPKPDPGAPCRQ